MVMTKQELFKEIELWSKDTEKSKDALIYIVDTKIAETKINGLGIERKVMINIGMFGRCNDKDILMYLTNMLRIITGQIEDLFGIDHIISGKEKR